MSDTIRVTDTSSTDRIEQAIRALRAKQNRMPMHWGERRAQVGDAIDALVDQWMAAKAGPNCRTCGRTKASCDAEPRSCCEVCRSNGHA